MGLFVDGMHKSMKDSLPMASCILVRKSGALNTNEDLLSGSGLVRDKLRAPPEDANVSCCLGIASIGWGRRPHVSAEKDY